MLGDADGNIGVELPHAAPGQGDHLGTEGVRDDSPLSVSTREIEPANARWIAENEGVVDEEDGSEQAAGFSSPTIPEVILMSGLFKLIELVLRLADSSALPD
ncbi:hypothetical protein U1Q18_032263 [Sarracenia purpurea var. burkii]